MRTKIDAKAASQICKALLLRRAAALHLVASFPQHEEALKKNLSWAYYLDQKGCGENGKLARDEDEEASEGDEDMEGDEAAVEMDGLSSYKFRKTLHDLLQEPHGRQV